jgi:hypothetical protein
MNKKSFVFSFVSSILLLLAASSASMAQPQAQGSSAGQALNGSAQVTTIPGGTRTTLWVLYGTEKVGRSGKVIRKVDLQPLDQIRWDIRGASVMINGSNSQASVPATGLKIKLDGVVIASGLSGNFTSLNAKSLSLAIEAPMLEAMRGEARLQVPQNLGLVINRCVNSEKVAIHCPDSEN